jgi:tetratricopeptide (TPR) repeat protein
MLETIREYGLERLAAAGEATASRERHLAWCLDLAERAEPELTGADQQRWFARLEREHDNLRAALAWALDRGAAESALRLGGALYRFWATEGHYEEGSRWLERALALAGGESTVARGNALLGAGVMAYFRGDYDAAADRWNAGLSLFRDLGHDLGVAYAYGNLGLVADAAGDYERAVASYEAALALFRRLDARTYVGFMLHNLGLIAYFERRYDRAAALFDEALDLARTLEDHHSVAMTLGNLGLVAFGAGDYERARTLHREALDLGRRLNNRPWLARGVEQVALLAAATGAPERAARLFGAAAAERRRFGGAQSDNDREINEAHIAETRARLGAAAFAAAWTDGESLTLDDAVAEALALTDRASRRVERAVEADQ